MKTIISFLFIIGISFFCIAQVRNDDHKSNIFFLKNGINKIDLNHDGVDDMVLSGYRNNITAHVFDCFTFYIYDKDFEKYDTPAWCIVEIENDTKEKSSGYQICNKQGADGYLSEIVLIENKDGEYQLLRADRAFGKSFADAAKVTLSYYSLVYDDVENRYSYKLQSKSITTREYTDVKEALIQEIK